MAVQGLGKWANLSPAALRSNLTSVMRLVNQLNSLKTATEFATSQGRGRCGSAALPASAGKPQRASGEFCALLETPLITLHLNSAREDETWASAKRISAA